MIDTMPKVSKGIRGIGGKPYINLDSFVDRFAFDGLIEIIWKQIDLVDLEFGFYSPKIARQPDALPEFQFLRLREPDSWHHKNFSMYNRWLDTSHKFPELRDFIECLPLKEIGRVKIFINEAHSSTRAHRDHNDCYIWPQREVYHENEFIWLNSDSDRKLFICSSDGEEKVVANCRALFFNEVDLHGSESFTKRNFSLRVDGKFSNDLRHGLSLPDPPY